MRTTTLVILVASFTSLAFAVPPGCLLHAVNTQDEPSDLSAVCGHGAQDVQSYIADNCGTFEETAQKAFVDTCSSAGTSVAAYTATSTSNGSSPTGAVHTTTTRTSISGSSASSVSSTAGANVDYRQGQMGPMAAAALALVGAVAAL